MTLLHFLGWLVGIASLLYFLLALVRPDWFLGAPASGDRTDKTKHLS